MFFAHTKYTLVSDFISNIQVLLKSAYIMLEIHFNAKHTNYTFQEYYFKLFEVLRFHLANISNALKKYL